MSEQEVQEKLDRVLEKESFVQKYVFQLLAIIFVAGGGWMTLDNVKALAEDNKEAIEQQEQDTGDVKEKLARIETTQEHIKDELEEQKELTQEVLREIRKLGEDRE